MAEREKGRRAEGLAAGKPGEPVLPGLSEDGAFVWGAGIESSCLPHLDVDQFEWTQHNRVWRDDLRRFRGELGLRRLRYAIPWHYIERTRSRYDWSIPDERLALCAELGIQPVLDIMHFGTPLWLRQAVGDPEFPEALEQLASELVRRYRGCVNVWCPVNEPLVTSLFSGDFGFWPPHSRQWSGYFPILSRVAQATSRAIRAIRAEQPEAIVLLCDAADHFQSLEPELKDEVALRNLRRFLLLDLIAGRVNAKHPLFEWVRSFGLADLDLDWFSTHPRLPDAIGLDYYSHSDWQLESGERGIRQKTAESPVGLAGVANDYYQRYGLPMLVTETSIDGPPINREVWLNRAVEDVRRLRADGVPLLGLFWWPLFDHLDWDGALTHRIGKLHQVGLYKLVKNSAGEFERVATGIADRFAELAAKGDADVGPLVRVAHPLRATDDEFETISVAKRPAALAATATASEVLATGAANPAGRKAIPAPAPAPADQGSGSVNLAPAEYGIFVFSHLRWGFVWQRPQQFLSRFARRHPILFMEEPFFDLAEGREPRIDLHQVMPNLTVATPHMAPSWASNPAMPDVLRSQAREAIGRVNRSGRFNQPLLWYYNPMDAIWSLGHFPSRGIVYDCMDELSKFSGASEHLVNVETWLMGHADIVFTGGYRLWERKTAHHDNVHFFGCGVEADHFGLAMADTTPVPPDIDFIARPILGWFGVVDERVDANLVGELARRKPQWSFAMVGPVVKVDPNLLPHAPNLYWLGGRDYSVLPNYCKAFDVCMMCFARNASTEYINPTKALEYLATGRPVISTPIQDVIRQYQGVMDIVATPDEFIAAAEKALAAPDRERIAAGLARVRECTWDSTVLKMQELIERGIRPDGRRSTKPVSPLDDVRLQYHYSRTPGS
jgi:beta-glucosidase/6-phospho-beta-glucosidase/beta-galactosidase/glycosyltransferase involved in cell wall biosynthesis